MTAAVIYTRVSSAEQVDNLSLDTQERECRAYCQREHLEVDRIFREEGESAKTAKRDQLQTMLTYCGTEAKRRNVGVLVVYRVDRLARAMVDYTAIRALLLKHGVTVCAVAESFDDSPSGKFFENVMAATAQFDNDLRAARTRDGMMEAVRRGRWVWRPPLGYLRAPDGAPMSLVLDPARAPLVRHGFEAIASRRLTKVEAVHELTGLGLLTRRGKRLSQQAFGKMLTNPLYMGRIVKAEWDVDLEGDFEALVEPSLFHQVQAVLRGRAPSRSSRMLDNPDFPLRRVTRCGHCSSPLTGSWSKGRSRHYPYYRCPQKGCPGSNVRKEHLEALLVRHLGEVTLKPEMLRLIGAVVQDEWTERARVRGTSEMELSAGLAALDEKRNRLVDVYLERGIDQATFERQSQRLEADETELRNRLKGAAPNDLDLPRAVELARSMLGDLPGCWNSLEVQHRGQFVGALFPAGLVYEDGALRTAQDPWWTGTSALETLEDVALG